MRNKLAPALALFAAALLASRSFPAETAQEKDTRPFCKTVDEAAKWVLSTMSADQTRRIAHLPEEGLIS